MHPDEAVAIGAALYAFSLPDNTNLKLQLLDVIPMGIGLEQADGQMHVVFPRNSPIPNAKQITGTTSVNNQTELIMRIWQGDHDTAKENEQLGEFTFSGIRQGPAGSGPGRDHLRREHRRHPHHDRERPRHRQGHEDHRPGHPELTTAAHTGLRGA